MLHDRQGSHVLSYLVLIVLCNCFILVNFLTYFAPDFAGFTSHIKAFYGYRFMIGQNFWFSLLAVRFSSPFFFSTFDALLGSFWVEFIISYHFCREGFPSLLYGWGTTRRLSEAWWNDRGIFFYCGTQDIYLQFWRPLHWLKFSPPHNCRYRVFYWWCKQLKRWSPALRTIKRCNSIKERASYRFLSARLHHLFDSSLKKVI